MEIGLLNTKVTLQKKTNSKNPLQNQTFDDYKSIWCHMHNMSANEVTKAEGLTATMNKKIIIRYRKELDLDYNENATKDFRIAYKTRTYDITHICPIYNNEFMELLLGSE